MIVRSAAQLLSSATAPDPTKFLRGDGAWGVPTGGVGGGNYGQAVVPFAAFASEDSVAVIGQLTITPTSRVTLTLLADSDDVVAQDWAAPYVSNLIAGVGFTVNVRAALGTFKGSVKCNWSWG